MMRVEERAVRFAEGVIAMDVDQWPVEHCAWWLFALRRAWAREEWAAWVDERDRLREGIHEATEPLLNALADVPGSLVKGDAR